MLRLSVVIKLGLKALKLKWGNGMGNDGAGKDACMQAHPAPTLSLPSTSYLPSLCDAANPSRSVHHSAPVRHTARNRAHLRKHVAHFNTALEAQAAEKKGQLARPTRHAGKPEARHALHHTRKASNKLCVRWGPRQQAKDLATKWPLP